MNRKLTMMIVPAVLLLAAIGLANAQLAPNVVLEAAIETATDQVILPATLAGRVTVRNCVGCQHSTLQLDASTKFNLAGQSVSLKEMAAYASGKRDQPLTIHYRLRDSVVSLISVLTK